MKLLIEIDETTKVVTVNGMIVNQGALVLASSSGEKIAKAYFDGNSLGAAILKCKPEYQVFADSVPTKLPGCGDKLPAILYRTAQDGATMNCDTPDHPYFADAASAPTPTPTPTPGATTITPDFVPGVSPSSGLPSVPPMSTGKRFFEHGAPVPGSFNDVGQPLDAEGRTCGPIPKPAYESEIGNTLRTKFVVIDGQRYDAWGNKITPDGSTTPQVESLFPVYGSVADLLAAAKDANYQIGIDVNGSQVWPGFGPDDAYVSQPDGSVVRVN